ncbi:MAG: aminoacyl-tRNA hydrolase [Alphaproteobacteria bacterium]|nr:aminoacyl-tRNA hydrolase [Alphaproteobacteria bacterium]
MASIRITATLALPEGELEFRAIRASGPGGQNVNKVSSAVQLRFDVERSTALPPAVRARLRRLAGSRLSKDGVLTIHAQSLRSHERNRAEAIERFVDLVRRAAVAPVPRRPTKPTKGARERRLSAKARRGQFKRLRRLPRGDDG